MECSWKFSLIVCVCVFLHSLWDGFHSVTITDVSFLHPQGRNGSNKWTSSCRPLRMLCRCSQMQRPDAHSLSATFRFNNSHYGNCCLMFFIICWKKNNFPFSNTTDPSTGTLSPFYNAVFSNTQIIPSLLSVPIMKQETVPAESSPRSTKKCGAPEDAGFKEAPSHHTEADGAHVGCNESLTCQAGISSQQLALVWSCTFTQFTYISPLLLLRMND